MNSDSTFWTDLGFTARRPFRNPDDYRRYISQLNDFPRYFAEQIDNMRAGLKRGFTPPKVTLTGRDAVPDRDHRSAEHRGQSVLRAVP